MAIVKFVAAKRTIKSALNYITNPEKTNENLKLSEKEHIELLERIAPEEFEIKHYAAIAELKKK